MARRRVLGTEIHLSFGSGLVEVIGQFTPPLFDFSADFFSFGFEFPDFLEKFLLRLCRRCAGCTGGRGGSVRRYIVDTRRTGRRFGSPAV